MRRQCHTQDHYKPRHGLELSALQSSIDALQRLRAYEVLDADDAEVLEEAYRFCERARNAHYLQTAQPSDALPNDKAELERLALLLGYVHRPHSVLRDDYRRVTRRARRVVERVFYDAG